MAVDPVCGMTVDPARAAGRVEHEGTTYYFCSKGCAAKFTADPKKYLAGAREAMAPAVMQIGGLSRRSGAPHTAAPSHAGHTHQHPAGSAGHAGAVAERVGGSTQPSGAVVQPRQDWRPSTRARCTPRS